MSLSREQLARMWRLLDEVVDFDDAGKRKWLQELPPEQRDLEPTLRHALDIDGPSLVAVPWDHTQNDRIAQAQVGRAPVTPG